MGGGGGDSPSSSSGEEDGDATWKAAISSIAAASVAVSAPNGSTKSDPRSALDSTLMDDDHPNPSKKKAANPGLKLYQIKAQKLLDDLVGKNLELVKNPIPLPEINSQSHGGGIRLFSKSPCGIVLDPIDPYSLPLKRPRIVPGEEINEKSKKFRKQLRSVAVDGIDIMASAKEACQRSLARFEARVSAADAKAKREEERIAELKKARGEKWLPSLAREVQGGRLNT